MDENQTPDVEQMTEATPPVGDTLSQQPALLEQVHNPDDVPTYAEGGFVKGASEDDDSIPIVLRPGEQLLRLVCPVCGLTACNHNLPYTQGVLK